FDMKHIRIPNNGKKYAMVGIDVFTKQAVIHVSNTCTSTAGKIAYQKVVSRFGKQAVYINDNGSENQDKAEQWLKDEGITQLWARPRTPKDKPCVERMIETLQVECLDYLEGPMNVTEIQTEINSWLKKYHGYRPHESLGFLTPDEFLTKFYLNSSPGVRVS
ncbi:MAG: transposase, partial [Treponema sp.]|nr:transposase [Treponema sp.]